MFLVALTAFALLVPNPLTQNCITCSNATLRQQTNVTFQINAFIGNGKATLLIVLNVFSCTIFADILSSSDTNVYNLLFVLGIIIILFSIALLFKEFYQFLQFGIKYFSVYNIVELVLYASSLVLAFTIVRVNECLCPHEVMYQFGAVAVFLAWMNLVLYFRKLSSTGTIMLSLEGPMFRPKVSLCC